MMDRELTSSCNGVQTLVLVGRTGNGKSATGNNILGRSAFVSEASSSGITSSCELQKTVLEDGQVINVIDTPGLFDITTGIDFFCKEIVRCVNLAKDGIHAILLVFSIRNRFSEEEEAALRTLRILFGSKIINYMIVVFTGGDELEERDKTLEDYLGRGCPQPLEDILIMCDNRMVLFNNKIKDKSKRATQVQVLLSLVNMIVDQNDGKPFTDELFAEMKKGASMLHEQKNVKDAKEEISLLETQMQMQRSYEDQLERIKYMVEENLRETTTKLEQELAEEQAARKRVMDCAKEAVEKSKDEIRILNERFENALKQQEEHARVAEKKSEDEIRKLSESLVAIQRERDEIRKRQAEKSCTIL